MIKIIYKDGKKPIIKFNGKSNEILSEIFNSMESIFVTIMQYISLKERYELIDQWIETMRGNLESAATWLEEKEK